MDSERVERLELITKRLMRRATKTARAIITPFPISNAVFGESIKGIVLRYMFPCDGVISKGMIRLGKKPKTSASFTVRVFNEVESKSAGFIIDKKTLAADLNIEVKAGDCLDVSLSSEDEPVTEVWISFLWKPTTKDVEVKSFLIEELENDLQKREKSLTSETGPLP